MKMTMRDQLSNVAVSFLVNGVSMMHEVQVEGMRQRQRCVDGFVYSAKASRLLEM